MTEPALGPLVTVAEAMAVIDGTPVTPRVEAVRLSDAAGRVLAGAIRADRDYPPFDKALMDGYAVRAGDGGPRRRGGEIAAGQAAGRPLGVGEATAIMTGASLPAGADAVVPIERITVNGDAVAFDGPVRAGDAVARRGLEAVAGDTVLPAGTRLTPPALAAAAQVGAVRVDVFARPRVGVLSTGDEIVPFETTPGGAQVRNGNTPMLLAVVGRLGCEAVDLGQAPDDPERIAAKLQTPGLDAILVTGGMSMGVYDYTPRVLRELGYDLGVTKLKIKPGKPFVFARRAAAVGTPVIFGLPGNPVSAFVCTVRLASRYLRRAGGGSPEPDWCMATLGQALAANGPREFYLPTAIEAGVARVLKWNGSADVFTLARADALLVRPADGGPLCAGSPVTLLRLP